jgi:hypothetical protein
MDHLDEHLATSALDLSLPASIRAAATLGKRTLNKYYKMTDLSEIYRIAMGKPFYFYFLFAMLRLTRLVVLHPRHKLDYFKTAKWDKVWINMARQIVREEYERTYKAPDKLTTPNAEHGDTALKVCYLNFGTDRVNLADGRAI